MKWFRRCIFAVIVLVCGAILLLAGGFILLRGQPDYYHGSTLTAEQQAVAAGSAEDKFRQILNSADLAHRDSALAAQATQTGMARATTVPAAINVTFTDDKLNSVFEKWSELNNWKT